MVSRSWKMNKKPRWEFSKLRDWLQTFIKKKSFSEKVIAVHTQRKISVIKAIAQGLDKYLTWKR